jgi:hypothetical protein
MTDWTTIRTLAAQAADPVGLPAAGSGVDLGQAAPFVEFRLRDLVLAGAPTSVTFSFWRVEGTVVEPLGSRTILAADVGIQKPLRFVCEESKVYVTVAFTGGAAPKVTGSIEARGLYESTVSPEDSSVASDAATAANQTNGTQKAIVRGGTKGATTPADVTSTARGADHQDLDVVDQGAKPVNKRAFVTTTIVADPTDLGADATGGFMVDISGNYKFRLAGDDDASFITAYLLAGYHYQSMVVRKFWITGSPAGAKVTGFLERV